MIETLLVRFRRSIGRNGPDYGLFSGLDVDERRALSELIMESGPLDEYTALALGYLGSNESKPALLKAVLSEDTNLRLGASRALWELEGSGEYLLPIATATGQTESLGPFDRMRAIGLLQDVNHPYAVSALQEAMSDPDYLVRRTAASTLARTMGHRVSEATLEKNLATLDSERTRRFALRLGKAHTKGRK